jgi:hypothetical protein
LTRRAKGALVRIEFAAKAHPYPTNRGKTMEPSRIQPPRRVQRCELRDGKLEYDYMGSSEFESGDRGRSLRRIFTLGIDWSSAVISVGGKEITVYMVATTGFPFDEYLPHIQAQADDTIRLKEWTNFDRVTQPQNASHHF